MGLNLFNIFCKKVTFEAAAKPPARPSSMETQEPIATTIETTAKPTSPRALTRLVAAPTPTTQKTPESTATTSTQPAPESTATPTEAKTQEAPAVDLPPEMLEQILKRLSPTDLASAMLVSRSLQFHVRTLSDILGF